MKHPALFLLLSALAALPAARAQLATEVLVGPTDKGGKSPLVSPFGVDWDSKGNMYIVEFKGGRVLKRTPDGTLTTIAGKLNAKGFAGENVPATEARFNAMHNVAVGKDDTLYLADSFNHCIRRIDPATGIITTFAGSGGKSGYSGDRGPAVDALFHNVINISFNPARDTLYIADINNRRIRAIDIATATVRTVAGNGKKGVPADGASAKDAPLVDPRAVTADAKGNVYILERGGHALRLVSPDGTIRTIAGTGKKGAKDGPALQAQLNGPKHISIHPDGGVLIADEVTGLIRRYDPKAKTLTTILGKNTGTPPRPLKGPHGVSVHQGRVYVVDSYNNRILVERE